MARPSLRDRFFTPQVARAIMSPSAILALVVGAGLGFAVGGVVLAIVVGLAAYAVRVAMAIPRSERGERIDPFTLSEPWRRFVQDAVKAQRRFAAAVDDARPGPTQDRLREIDDRVETGVREVWRIAKRGHDLVDARRQLDPPGIRRAIAAAEASAPPPEAATASHELRMDALRAQLAAADRLEAVIADADSRLRLLNARLDEAAARTIELSVQAHDATDLRGLGHDVDVMVEEMEALRQAIEETGGGGAQALGTG